MLLMTPMMILIIVRNINCSVLLPIIRNYVEDDGVVVIIVVVSACVVVLVLVTFVQFIS